MKKYLCAVLIFQEVEKAKEIISHMELNKKKI
jgi:hypothetical protein